MQRRILVHLPASTATGFVVAQFTQSVVGAFERKAVAATDSIGVYANLLNDKFYISDTKQFPDSSFVQIKRPTFCPITSLPPTLASQLPLETLQRGIDVGCALILETSDGLVLLTRRAAHLRTFPGVWVPPGGHVEVGESLVDAVLREVREETGLKLTVDDCCNQTISTLALWESTYPPMLSLGLPVRHHVVVYMHAKLRDPLTSDLLESRLRLDPTEVGAAVWLSRSMAQSIVAVSDIGPQSQDDEQSPVTDLEFPPEIPVTLVSADGTLSRQSMSSCSLLHRAPSVGDDIERVSTGTKFALEQWINSYTKDGS